MSESNENLFKTEQDVYEAASQAIDGMEDMTGEDQANFGKELIKLACEFLSKEDHWEMIEFMQQTLKEWPGQ